MSLLSQQNCQAPHQAVGGTGGPYRRLRLGSLPVVLLRGEGQEDLEDGIAKIAGPLFIMMNTVRITTVVRDVVLDTNHLPQ